MSHHIRLVKDGKGICLGKNLFIDDNIFGIKISDNIDYHHVYDEIDNICNLLNRTKYFLNHVVQSLIEDGWEVTQGEDPETEDLYFKSKEIIRCDRD